MSGCSPAPAYWFAYSYERPGTYAVFSLLMKDYSLPAGPRNNRKVKGRAEKHSKVVRASKALLAKEKYDKGKGIIVASFASNKNAST